MQGPEELIEKNGSFLKWHCIVMGEVDPGGVECGRGGFQS